MPLPYRPFRWGPLYPQHSASPPFPSSAAAHDPDVLCVIAVGIRNINESAKWLQLDNECVLFL